MLGPEHLSLAEAAFAKRGFAEAAAQARQALAADLDAGVYGSERGEYWPHPQTARAELLLGMSLHEQGESDAAMPHLDRAVDLDRETAELWGNRGHVRRERGELELAIADLSHALGRSPGYAFARLRRAQCYVTLGKAVEAEADLAVVLTANPYDAAPLALWQDLRRQRGAADDIGQLPAPNDFASLLNRAALHLMHGAGALALADYDAAFVIYPQPVVRAYRGMAHQRLGNLSLAIEDLEAYAAFDASNEPVRQALLDVRARLERAKLEP